MKKRTVVLVKMHGPHRGQSQQRYDEQVETMREELVRIKRRDPATQGEEPAFVVEVVDNVAALKEKGRVIDVNIAIFFSAAMIPEARAIRRQYSWIKVFVLTGEIPDDEIVILNKWGIDDHVLEQLLGR